MSQEYGYINGTFDIIRIKDINMLERASQLNREKGKKYLGVGVLESDLIEGGTINTTDERIKMITAFRGIDFAYAVTKEAFENREVMSACVQKAFQEFISAPKKQKTTNAKYDAMYLPGTWDLLHTGHLENISEAAKLGNKLIVGVKSDELVLEHKHRQPIITAEERMNIIRHLKDVDLVIQSYSRNPQIALETIQAEFGIKVDAIAVGTDLTQDFQNMKGLFEGVDLVFTPRPVIGGPSTTEKMAKLHRKKTPTKGKDNLSNEHSEIHGDEAK